jgi:hypothetical protein
MQPRTLLLVVLAAAAAAAASSPYKPLLQRFEQSVRRCSTAMHGGQRRLSLVRWQVTATLAALAGNSRWGSRDLIKQPRIGCWRRIITRRLSLIPLFAIAFSLSLSFSLNLSQTRTLVPLSFIALAPFSLVPGEAPIPPIQHPGPTGGIRGPCLLPGPRGFSPDCCGCSGTPLAAALFSPPPLTGPRIASRRKQTRPRYMESRWQKPDFRFPDPACASTILDLWSLTVLARGRSSADPGAPSTSRTTPPCS